MEKKGKFGVICINPIPIPNPQSTIPNPSSRNLQKFSLNLPSSSIFSKKKWKKEGKFGVICINPIPNPQSSIHNPQSPILNPQSPIHLPVTRKNFRQIYLPFLIFLNLI